MVGGARFAVYQFMNADENGQNWSLCYDMPLVSAISRMIMSPDGQFLACYSEVAYLMVVSVY